MEENSCCEHECPIIQGHCLVEWVSDRLAGQRVKDLVLEGNDLSLVFDGGETLQGCQHPGWMDGTQYRQLSHDPADLLDELAGYQVTYLRYFETGDPDLPGLLQLELFPDDEIHRASTGYEPVLVVLGQDAVLTWMDHLQADRKCPD